MKAMVLDRHSPIEERPLKLALFGFVFACPGNK